MHNWDAPVEKERSMFPKEAKHHEFFWTADRTLFMRNSVWNTWFPIGLGDMSDEEVVLLKGFIDGDYKKFYHDPGLDREDQAKDIKNGLKGKINDVDLDKFCKFIEQADFTETFRHGQRM